MNTNIILNMSITRRINEILGLNEEIVPVWIVSWDAFLGDDSRHRVAKAFINHDDAKKFAQSLKDAQNLLQNTSSICLKIEEQK